VPHVGGFVAGVLLITPFLLGRLRLQEFRSLSKETTHWMIDSLVAIDWSSSLGDVQLKPTGWRRRIGLTRPFLLTAADSGIFLAIASSKSFSGSRHKCEQYPFTPFCCCAEQQT
jgi:hypothetical protein